MQRLGAIQALAAEQHGVIARRQLFAAGLQIAMPVIGALLLANLILGVLTRTAPQLNLFAVGFPITLIVGLLMLWLGMPYLIPAFEAALAYAQQREAFGEKIIAHQAVAFRLADMATQIAAARGLVGSWSYLPDFSAMSSPNNLACSWASVWQPTLTSSAV